MSCEKKNCLEEIKLSEILKKFELKNKNLDKIMKNLKIKDIKQIKNKVVEL